MALVTELKGVVDSFSELTAQHVRLARLELAEDARFVGVRLGVIAGLAPLVLVGYGFLCVALSLALRQVMPVEAAFAVVGLLNLLGGALGIVLAGRQLGARKVMGDTVRELDATSAVVRPPGEVRP
jgi:uncharacterized membrane protein YqjE